MVSYSRYAGALLWGCWVCSHFNASCTGLDKQYATTAINLSSDCPAASAATKTAVDSPN